MGMNGLYNTRMSLVVLQASHTQDNGHERSRVTPMLIVVVMKSALMEVTPNVVPREQFAMKFFHRNQHLL